MDIRALVIAKRPNKLEITCLLDRPGIISQYESPLAAPVPELKVIIEPASNEEKRSCNILTVAAIFMDDGVQRFQCPRLEAIVAWTARPGMIRIEVPVADELLGIFIPEIIYHHGFQSQIDTCLRYWAGVEAKND